MKRTLILAAIAAALTMASAAPARADQLINFDIAGAGRVVADGVDCSRTLGGPLVGDCQAFVVDGPDECNEQFCFPTPGQLLMQAQAASGFQFERWSHPQCLPVSRNPCLILVAVRGPNPPLTVTATFRDAQLPSVSLSSPANGALVRGTIPLSATASGAVASLAFRVRGALFQTLTAPPFATTLDTRGFADGPAAITATGTNANGSSSATANVTFDNTNPTLKLDGPEDGAVFSPGSKAEWSIVAVDATTGPPAVQCSVATQGRSPVFGPCSSPTQESLANLRAGRYTLTVRATDGAGNAALEARSFSVGAQPIPIPCAPTTCHGHG
jgi:Bacterial Ig domain